MNVYYPSATVAHTCDLPWESIGYGSTGCPDGTITVCNYCCKKWVSVPAYGSMGPTSKWVKIRWWHRTARARLRLINGEEEGAW